MGNTNSISPAQCAISTYSTFLKGFFSEETLKKFSSLKDLQSTADHQFAIFLDDFLVNDTQFQEYNDEGKKICTGGLCFLHSAIPFNAESLSSIKESMGSHSETLVKFFNDETPALKVLSGYLATNYCWDGSAFYKWSEDSHSWKACSEEDISVDEFVKGACLSTVVRTCGVTDPLVVDGVTSISQYCKDLSEAAASFKTSKTYTEVVDLIKTDVKKFNKTADLIACHSGAVVITKGSQRDYKSNDDVLVKLSYDPSKESTGLVERFLDSVKCDKKELANHIVRCGASLKPCLTLVCGPEGSGKTTLLRLTRALYGPFACTSEEYESGSVDRKLVRCCVIDDSSFLSDEEAVKNHPCDHLVVSCESSELGETFGDRKVRRLVFESPLDSEEVKEDFATNLSTRKQLSSLLGWALQNYSPSDVVGRSASSGASLMEMLMGGRGCGNPNCPNCGGAGDSQGGPDLLSMLGGGMPSGVKIMKMGPNGLEEVGSPSDLVKKSEAEEDQEQEQQNEDQKQQEEFGESGPVDASQPMSD